MREEGSVDASSPGAATASGRAASAPALRATARGVDGPRQRSGRFRHSVTARITLFHLIVTVAFSLVAGWNVVALRAATQEAELMRSGYLPLALVLRNAVRDQDTWSSQLNHVTAAKNPADKQVWFDANLSVGRPRSFEAVQAALSRAFGQRGDLAELARSLSRQAESIRDFLAADRQSIERLFAALRARQEAQAVAERDILVKRSHEGRLRLAELEAQVTASVQRLLEEARSREKRAVRVLVGLSVMTCLMGLLVAWRSRRILAPLSAVTERARVVARGDLTPHPVVATSDEIGELAATFESMVAAIAQANAELLSSERLAAIGKMAAQVTHEVRNPLSSLALNLDLLEEELGDRQGEVLALLRAAQSEVDRLTQLTEKYLSLARRSRPDLHEEDAGQVVADALSAAQAELARAGVETELTLPASPALTLLDEAQLRQVLLNLFRNAREAMPEGGVLEVSVEQSDSSGIEICVADTGKGMDADTREQVFEPFFTTKGHGTGLGLAITREIVEAHGGRVACEANAPAGTRFVITLPLRRPAVGAEPTVPLGARGLGLT